MIAPQQLGGVVTGRPDPDRTLRRWFEKPRPDFPLTPHPAGYWVKKIAGKLRRFGHWSDPAAAERRLQQFLAGDPEAAAAAARRRARQSTFGARRSTPTLPDARRWLLIENADADPRAQSPVELAGRDDAIDVIAGSLSHDDAEAIRDAAMSGALPPEVADRLAQRFTRAELGALLGVTVNPRQVALAQLRQTPAAVRSLLAALLGQTFPAGFAPEVEQLRQLLVDTGGGAPLADVIAASRMTPVAGRTVANGR